MHVFRGIFSFPPYWMFIFLWRHSYNKCLVICCHSGLFKHEMLSNVTSSNLLDVIDRYLCYRFNSENRLHVRVKSSSTNSRMSSKDSWFNRHLHSKSSSKICFNSIRGFKQTRNHGKLKPNKKSMFLIAKSKFSKRDVLW